MMTLNEYVDNAISTGQRGIFATLKRLGNYDFAYYSDEMDVMMLFEYGNRLIHPKLAGVSVEEVCKMIMKTYGTKWNQYSRTSKNNLDITAKTSRVVTERISTNINSNGTNNNTNKVSAYNSNEMLNTDGSVNETDNKEDKETEREVIDRNVSYNDMYDNIDLVAKRNTMLVAIQDVVEYTTLKIY